MCARMVSVLLVDVTEEDDHVIIIESGVRVQQIDDHKIGKSLAKSSNRVVEEKVKYCISAIQRCL